MTTTSTNGSDAKPVKEIPMQKVMHEILTQSGGPMKTKDLIAATMADDRVTPGGKAPEKMISAVIYKNAKLGRLFKKVEKGTFVAIPIVVADGDGAAPKRTRAAKPTTEKAKVVKVIKPKADAAAKRPQAKSDPKPGAKKAAEKQTASA